MGRIRVKPTRDHPVPYSEADEPVPTLLEALAVAGNTAELQVALGASPATSEADPSTIPFELEKNHAGLRQVLTNYDRTPLQQLPTALAAAAFLREYGSSLALDVAATRAAITNKLMEIANCGDPRYELRALELLGKHVDIGLFTDRSEITINYKSPADLEAAITERVKRLLNADIIDVTPIGFDLDKEFGVLPEVKDIADPDPLPVTTHVSKAEADADAEDEAGEGDQTPQDDWDGPNNEPPEDDEEASDE
jgi:hypothetical protein